MPHPQQHPPPAGHAASAVAAYCASSILMTVTNKLVLSSFDFRLNFLLLAIQSAAAVALLVAFARARWLTFRPLVARDARAWAPVSLALVLMIYANSRALQFLSIPVFTIFKNLSIILTAYAERVLLRGPPVSPLMLLSFAFIVLSSIVAAWADISAGASLRSYANGVIVPYAWMLAACFSASAYTLMMKFKIKSIGFHDFDTVFYNNLLSIPTLLIFYFIFEIPESIRLYERYWGSAAEINASEFYALIAGIAVSSVAGFAIGYSTSWCVRVTSSTTYSMVGALNKLPISVAGMIFFDAVVTFASVSSIIIAFIGGLIYAVARTRQSAEIARSLPSYQIVKDSESIEETIPMSSNTNIGQNKSHH